MINLFDYCISNPPYQVSTKKTDDKNNNTMNIFPLFYSFGLFISNGGAMIFPGGRWMQRSGKNISTSNLIYQSASKIYWYSNNSRRREVFPDAIITDGLSIVEWNNLVPLNKNIILNGYIFSRPKNDEILPLNRELTSITVKLMNNYSNIFHRKYTSQIFKLPSYYVERNHHMVIPIYQLLANKNNYVRAFLGNEVSGSAKRVNEYWLNRDAIKWNSSLKKLYSNWKVVGTAGDISKGCHVIYRVLDNNTVVGESWIIVGDFSTYDEAYNYKNYLNSLFAQVLAWEGIGAKVSGWGKFIPDLMDYSMNNPLFCSNDALGQDHIYYGLDLNERLYKYFNLSQQEIEILNNFDF